MDVFIQKKIPVLFIGHSSPTNAILENEFTKSLPQLGISLPRPKAILVISAHWLTKGTYVSTSEKPETIYDFYGFQKEMYEIVYPCPGAPSYAHKVQSLVHQTNMQFDAKMGLDHGAWTVLKYLYPKSDVPVFQMSIDITQSMEYHYDIAKELRMLRQEFVLIIGSGNIVHNLRMVRFDDEQSKPFDWAVEFDDFVKKNIVNRNHDALLNYNQIGYAARLSVPTTDHYIPMIYAVGLQEQDNEVNFTFEGFHYGSVSMRSFQIG